MKNTLVVLFFSLAVSLNGRTLSEYICPEITSPNQSFCIDSNPTVSDLQPSNVIWYGSNDSNAETISANTPLTDGMIYYAGDLDETCTIRPQVAVTLSEQAYAGNDAISEECEADIQALFPAIYSIWNYYKGMLDPGVPKDGTFNPSAQRLVELYNSQEVDGYLDMTTTYTVGEPGCQDSVELTIRVHETADAGTDTEITLFNNEAPVNLQDYLGDNVTKGGTWSELEGGIFDPSIDVEGDYTYTVDGCTGLDSATVSVRLIPPGCPTVSETIQSFCRSSYPGNKIADLVATDNGGGVAWYSGNSSTTALGSDTDIEDGGVYYAGSSDGIDCVGDRIAVTVNFLDTPNAGKTTFLTFNSNDPTVDLRNLIQQTELEWPVDSGGFMTPGTSAGGTVFTPALDANWTGRKQLKHIVTSDSECPDDDSVIYITINPQPNSGHRMVFLGATEDDAQDYLENNDIQSGEGLLVNIWTPTQLQVDSVYRINIDDEDRYYYVNNIYSDPQTEPDLTLTSDTEITQTSLIEVIDSTFQEVSEAGSSTTNRLALRGGVTINNEQLLVEGRTMNTFPLMVTANIDSISLQVFDGELIQGNIHNTLRGRYKHKGGGEFQYLTNTTNSDLYLLSADTISNKLLSLQSNDITMSIGSRGLQEYYSLRQELDSLSGNLDLVFEENEFNPVRFGSDTTMVFNGRLKIGDSIAKGYDLVVGGAMISESLIMQLESNWPDYVFSKYYKLPSLTSLKAYIEEHKHLPGMPSATEVANKGMDIPETNRILLEKLEELTLRVLKMDKDIEELNKFYPNE